ncbi:MAG: alcohol dehydrogenase catalytic domain-containing protein [Vicinamibacteraceae bacterium]
MLNAVRLHAPRDLRLETAPALAAPGPGHVRIRVGSVGLCGSDLHMYETGRIGDAIIKTPLVLGHEFGGVVLDAPDGTVDALGRPLTAGTRVAVDPAVPCHHCRQCEEGHPNLCPHHSFYGVWPDDGALRDEMLVDARNCFPVPATLSEPAVALLETLGVAVHAVDLGRLRVGDGVGVVGCGPVGLLLVRLAKLSGASPIVVWDKHPWRVAKALALGADEGWRVSADGVPDGPKAPDLDIGFEAAWADRSVQHTAEIVRPGGRVVLVGIPGDDRLQLSHGTARRKGLTIRMARRMKHTYPRAIALAASGQVDLDDLVSHRFELARTAEAYAMNMRYPEGLLKAVIDCGIGG